MLRSVWIGLAFVLSLCAVTEAQEVRRITVVTLKGDVIEGVLKSATGVELSVEVAGQQLRLPLSTLKLISFVGRIDEARAASSPVSPMDDAFKALNELAAATEIGMLRDQYSQKLIDTLPRVRAFTKVAAGWDDVRAALELAIVQYQEPLADLANWKSAGGSMAAGRKWAEYAKELATRDGEETHSETSAEQDLRVGKSVRGRLGKGDRQMPGELDRSSQGAFNDVFRLKLDSVTQVSVVVSCGTCKPHLTLADASGRKIEGDAGYSGKSTIKRQLKPGVYSLWVGEIYAGEVGEYTLEWLDR